MWKFEITRTEAIPFREQDWTIMQMKQYEVSVKVIQEEWETVEKIEEQLDIVFNRNLEKTLEKDSVYQRQKNQLNFIVEEIKKVLSPLQAREIILKAKNIKS